MQCIYFNLLTAGEELSQTIEQERVTLFAAGLVAEKQLRLPA